MRIYEGSPRQDYEEVLRSIGAFLDQRGMHDVLLVEAPDGFILQGVAMESEASARSESAGYQVKETLTFLDDDIARFMEEAVARRTATTAVSDWTNAGYYEKSFRVVGKWIDEQKPRDIFFFEQEGAYVVRLHKVGPAGAHHMLAEFTKDDIEGMIAQAPQARRT
jgi:hypothetical protein